MKKMTRHLVFVTVALIAFAVLMSGMCSAGEGGEAGFEIKSFEITGNSLLPKEKLQDATSPFTGPGKTTADVEKAREALEKLYHEGGYPAVMVNIPEQTLKDDVVRLEVIESRIGRVVISGNRYVSTDKLVRDLPSMKPGKMLYLPTVQEEIGRLNRTPDLKVEPVMTPGKEPGTIDVELKVEDRFSMHGYLELNNRASHDTKELRVNGMLRYDNLWQMDHSLSLQFQVGPQAPKEVLVFGASYSLPAPWERDHQLAFFGILSDSDNAFGQGYEVIGKGQIFGARYVLPLPQYQLYAHNLTLGLDYKHFNQSVGFTTSSGDTTHTPVSYMPLSFSYNASLPDEWGGVTQFVVGVNLSFRGLVADEKEFELKRYKATANYFYATAGIQRTQKLPMGMGLFAKVDGQVSNQPLIDNEEYSAGGMESVRGYRESEALGDDAVHGMLEWSFPNPLEKFSKQFQMVPFLFYDIAALNVKDPLEGQKSSLTLQGIGLGMRGAITKNLEYEVDWAVALAGTPQTDSGEQRCYFKVKAVF